MEFFCYHRDRPGSLSLRAELLEEHWSYMDQYAGEMIARGPTLADDCETPTGSVHIIDLPDRRHRPRVRLRRAELPGRGLPGRAAAAVAQPAGAHHVGLSRRPDRGNRYLVLGLGDGPTARPPTSPCRADRDELIAFGPLLSDDGADLAGHGGAASGHPTRTRPAPS